MRCFALGKQSQRTSTLLFDKDLYEEVVAPARSFSFACDAGGCGVAIEQGCL
jgi:hypothetical protein